MGERCLSFVRSIEAYETYSKIHFYVTVQSKSQVDMLGDYFIYTDRSIQT